MTVEGMGKMFNRALAHAFELKKIFFLTIALSLCGLLFLFFHGFTYEVLGWRKAGFFFFPFFLSMGVLAASGVGLVRLYQQEMKQINISLTKLANTSWNAMIMAACLFIPFLMIYLIIWLLVGIFLLLSHIPLLGTVIGVILSFVPFLLNVASIFLMVLSLLILFFLVPLNALKEKMETRKSFQFLIQRIQRDWFTHFLLFLVAFFPLWILFKLLSIAFHLTQNQMIEVTEPLERLFRLVFIMIPFAFLLAPAVCFFFNFASETYHWSISRWELKPPQEEV